MKRRIAVILLTAALLTAVIYAYLHWDNVLRPLEPSFDILLMTGLDDDDLSAVSALTVPDGNSVNPRKAEKDQ